MAPPKSSSKKSKSKKSSKRRQALTNVNKSLQPFANRYVCKQKYSTTITTGVLSGQYTFNMNSMFDPDRFGTGHQPYGFDYIVPMYNKYRVISCGWRVSLPLNILNGQTSNSYTVGAIPSNDPGISWANTDELLENPRAKYITQNPGAPVVYLTGKSYLPTLFGRTKAQYMADDRCAAQVSGSPLEEMILYLQTFNATSGVATGGINLTVVLEFTVEYFDPKRILQS